MVIITNFIKIKICILKLNKNKIQYYDLIFQLH